DVVCVVATVRALKYHGGVQKDALEQEDVEAMLAGMTNLEHHLGVLRDVYGLTPVVSLNRFPSDTDAEVTAAIDHLAGLGVRAVSAELRARGGAGALGRAAAVTAAAAARGAAGGGGPRHPYALEASPVEKIEALARQVYRAGS